MALSFDVILKDTLEGRTRRSTIRRTGKKSNRPNKNGERGETKSEIPHVEGQSTSSTHEEGPDGGKQ